MPLTISCAFFVAASVVVLDPSEELLDELVESEDEDEDDDEDPSAVMLVDDEVELSEE
jgi:hypothetical protein